MTEAERERAAIVRWMRSVGDELAEEALETNINATMARALEICQAARRIERGEHLTNEGK